MEYRYAGYALTDLAKLGIQPLADIKAACDADPAYIDKFNYKVRVTVDGEDYRLVPAFQVDSERKNHVTALREEFGNEMVLLPFYEAKRNRPVIFDCLYFTQISCERFFRCLRFFSGRRDVKQSLDEIKKWDNPVRVQMREILFEHLRSMLAKCGAKDVVLDESYPAYAELEEMLDIIGQEIYVGYGQLENAKGINKLLEARYRELHKGGQTLRRLSLSTALLALSAIERTLMNHEILENRREHSGFEDMYMRSAARAERIMTKVIERQHIPSFEKRDDMTLDAADISGILHELATEIFKGAAVTLFRRGAGREAVYMDFIARSAKETGTPSVEKIRDYLYPFVDMYHLSSRIGKVGACGGGIYVAERNALQALALLQSMGMEDEVQVELGKTRLLMMPPVNDFDGDKDTFKAHLKQQNLQGVISEMFTRSIRVISISESNKKNYKPALRLYKAAKEEMHERYDALIKTRPHFFGVMEKYFKVLDENLDVVRFSTKGKRHMLSSLNMIRGKVHELSGTSRYATRADASERTSRVAEAAIVQPPSTAKAEPAVA